MFSELTAGDLRRDDKAMAHLRERSYLSELEKCLKEINDAYEQRKTSIYYSVPAVSITDPFYEMTGSLDYITNKLRTREFIVNMTSDERTIYISWQESAVKKKAVSTAEPEADVRRTVESFQYSPNSAISGMQLRTSLMRRNPNYAHLESLKPKTKTSKKNKQK